MTQYPPGGVLFPNDRKANEKAPDFKGNLELDQALADEIAQQLRANPRAKLEIAGWRKSKNGKEFVSLRVQPPYKRESTQNAAPATQPPDDEIPF